jgi:hypothetical protein
MSPRVHRRARIAALALLLSGIAAWFIPSYISAGRYRRGLQTSLERTLHRHVTFGRVSLQVLPRPGFVIENAVIQEDPNFGSEPFVRVDRIECDVRWQSLLGARLSFSHFRLQHPNINLVRHAGGGWNVEHLLLATTRADLTGGVPRNLLTAANLQDGAPRLSAPGVPPDWEVEDGRVNFKLGENKKPLAITELSAQLSFDPTRSHMRFRLSGYPVRTDLALPTPGAVEITGDWTPGRDLLGPLNIVVRAREALVYDWAPLVTGRDPGMYGVMDAELRASGSIRRFSFEGRGRLSELHQWERIPPSDSMPWTITVRGQLDRDRGRVLLESTDASFADSHLRLSGTIDYFPRSPELDLALALERSRLEDLMALAGRFWTLQGGFGLRGQVDGSLAVQGPWDELSFSGNVGARNVVLRTRSATFPVSDLLVRIDNDGAQLAPARITLAPRVVLETEGSLDRSAKTHPYEFTFSCKSAPLRNVLDFGRALGMRTLQGWNAVGYGTASFHIAGSLGSPARPTLKGRAELRSARLVIPGLTEPINVPRANLQVNGTEIMVERLLAVLGTSVLAGRLEHHGDSHQPWLFDLHADSLDLGQGASWFVALPHRNPGPLVQRFPGLASFALQREAASNLFSSLNARGRFSASKITYRNMGVDKFQTNAEVIGRVIRLSNATFQTGGGQGRLSGRLDLSGRPAHLAADVALSGIAVQSLASRLPAALRGARGLMNIVGHVETAGLSREEMSQNLDGHVAIIAKSVTLAGFDPLDAFARLARQGALEPVRGPVTFHSVTLDLQIHDRAVVLKKTNLECSGARLSLAASRPFDGPVTLRVAADLAHVRRRWLNRSDAVGPELPPPELDFSGPLDKLAPTNRIPDSGVRSQK